MIGSLGVLNIYRVPIRGCMARDEASPSLSLPGCHASHIPFRIGLDHMHCLDVAPSSVADKPWTREYGRDGDSQKKNGYYDAGT
jgi:hypothetical protein